MSLNEEILNIAKSLVATLSDRGIKVVTAESCTGGMIASAITSIAGSSSIFDCGIIAYSNEVKHQLLGINRRLLETHGAVSEQVVIAMAEGALLKYDAGLSIAVTGIAGPSGGSIEKPVGLVYIAFSFAHHKDGVQTIRFQNIFKGNRNHIRANVTIKALSMALDIAKNMTY
jgi:nicotinamide-nucleotide amidase